AKCENGGPSNKGKGKEKLIKTTPTNKGKVDPKDGGTIDESDGKIDESGSEVGSEEQDSESKHLHVAVHTSKKRKATEVKHRETGRQYQAANSQYPEEFLLLITDSEIRKCGSSQAATLHETDTTGLHTAATSEFVKKERLLQALPNKLFLATKRIDSELEEGNREHYYNLVQERKEYLECLLTHQLQNLQDVIKANVVDSSPKVPISSEVKCPPFNPSDEIHLAIKKLMGDTTIPLIKGSLTEIDFAALKHLTGDFTKGHPELKFDTTRTRPCEMVVDIAITFSNFKTDWENFFQKDLEFSSISWPGSTWVTRSNSLAPTSGP
ncbi:hypothetical protein BGZ74_005234, partial [Mortierella antarctica]